MKAINMPSQIWDFTMIGEPEIRSCTARDNYPTIEGRIPIQIIDRIPSIFRNMRSLACMIQYTTVIHLNLISFLAVVIS